MVGAPWLCWCETDPYAPANPAALRPEQARRGANRGGGVPSTTKTLLQGKGFPRGNKVRTAAACRAALYSQRGVRKDDPSRGKVPVPGPGSGSLQGFLALPASFQERPSRRAQPAPGCCRAPGCAASESCAPNPQRHNPDPSRTSEPASPKRSGELQSRTGRGPLLRPSSRLVPQLPGRVHRSKPSLCVLRRHTTGLRVHSCGPHPNPLSAGSCRRSAA